MPGTAKVAGAAVRFALGSGILGGLLLSLSPQTVAGHLESADVTWFGLAAALYAASLLVRGLRLSLLLQPHRPLGHWTTTTSASTFGWSLNNLLPFRLGDVVRVYLVAVRNSIGLPAAVLAAIAERLLDVAVLGSAAVLLAGPRLLGTSGIPGAGLTALALGAAATASVYLLARLAPDRLTTFPLFPRADAFLRRAVASVSLAFRTHLRGRALLSGLVLTAAAWSFQFAQYLTFFRAFGLEPDTMVVLAGFAVFMLSFALNFVPGQVGTYEALFVGIFSAAGVASPDLLLAIALTTHVVNSALLSLFGAASYLHLGVGWTDLAAAWRGANFFPSPLREQANVKVMP